MKVLKASIGKETRASGSDYEVIDELREVRSSDFPLIQRQIAFAVLFQFALQDWNRRFSINFLIEKTTGTKITDVTFDMVPAEMFGRFKPKMPVCINAENIEFVEPGDYHFVIKIDGKVARETLFKLIAVSANDEEFEFVSGLKVLTAAVCKKGELSDTNTSLHLQGIHFQTAATSFPFRLDALNVAGFIQIPPYWQGRKLYLQITLLDSGSKKISGVSGEMVAPPGQGTLTIAAPFVLSLDAIAIPKPQMLRIEIRIENEIKKQLPYEILSLDKPRETRHNLHV